MRGHEALTEPRERWPVLHRPAPHGDISRLIVTRHQFPPSAALTARAPLVLHASAPHASTAPAGMALRRAWARRSSGLAAVSRENDLFRHHGLAAALFQLNGEHPSDEGQERNGSQQRAPREGALFVSTLTFDRVLEDRRLLESPRNLTG